MRYYILQDKNPVLADNPKQWTEWFNNSDRTVDQTDVDGFFVSTVFLGLDHNFYMRDDDSKPMLFETMVLGDKTRLFMGKDYNRRYSTWDEAQEGHQKIVQIVEGWVEWFDNVRLTKL